MLNNFNLNQYEKTWAHNPEVTGSKPDPATSKARNHWIPSLYFFILFFYLSVLEADRNTVQYGAVRYEWTAQPQNQRKPSTFIPSHDCTVQGLSLLMI